MDIAELRDNVLLFPILSYVVFVQFFNFCHLLNSLNIFHGSILCILLVFELQLFVASY